MKAEEIIAYLEGQATEHAEEKEHFSELADLYKRKLYHQITVKLQEIVLLDFYRTETRLLTLHDNFVVHCAKNINPLRYASFVVQASRQITDAAAAVAFLDKTAETLTKNQQATLVCKMELSGRKLELGEADACQALLAEGRKLVDSYSGIMEPACHSMLYHATFTYAKHKGEAVEYFKNCMLYLTYTPLATIPADEQQKLAFDVGLAALLGDHIYNFGELLQHPVLKSLDEKQAWLGEMLMAFNKGDISGYEKLRAAHVVDAPALDTKKVFLDEKVRIMALMETTFQKGGDERTLSFAEISESCDMAEDQVELLLMKSFSKGVVKGKMDQVSGEVRITWVQPRVLDMSQVESIKERLQGWAGKVDETAVFVEGTAPELFVQSHQ